MSTFKFRCLQFSWGIAIDVTARLIVDTRPPVTGTEVAPGLFLVVGDTLHVPDVDLKYAESGLRRVALSLRSESSQGATIVALDDLWYRGTDYQPEGVEAAMIAWAAEEAGFVPPRIEISFDREMNRYLFLYKDDAERN